MQKWDRRKYGVLRGFEIGVHPSSSSPPPSLYLTHTNHFSGKPPGNPSLSHRHRNRNTQHTGLCYFPIIQDMCARIGSSCKRRKREGQRSILFAKKVIGNCPVCFRGRGVSEFIPVQSLFSKNLKEKVGQWEREGIGKIACGWEQRWKDNSL